MKTKKIISLIVILLFVAVAFSGCMNKKAKKIKQPQPAATQQQTKQETKNEDAIDFSDPGDDEIGKDIQEIDDLINETSPSDYNEDDLSEEGFDAQLQ